MANYLGQIESAVETLSNDRFISATEKIHDQLELRALSCIQIATKLCLKSQVDSFLRLFF